MANTLPNGEHEDIKLQINDNSAMTLTKET